MNKNIFLLFLSVFGLSYCGTRQELLLTTVDGVKNPLISMNGTWLFSLKPAAEFWKVGGVVDKWSEITVPGEPAMQGFEVKHDQPVAYQKSILIPSDYSGKKVFLRFDGVYSYTRLWVNGHFIRDHKGGFTRWYADITEYAEPGKQALIALEVTDKLDDISYGSGYAKHPIGGILRSVFLEARPEVSMDYWRVETDLDENFENALLTIDFKAVFMIDGEAQVTLRLFDPSGSEILLKNNMFHLGKDTPEKRVEFFVKKPQKWNAEHPVLYALQSELQVGGRRLWTGYKKIGFREVQVEGNRLLVNGREVKLRGACRHDIHPLLGRVGMRYYDSLDAVLAREANVNFIRTSHYPPTEDFVEFCDRMGIYVECESAVCFVDTHRSPAYGKGASESDPAFRDQYISQVEEMVELFRDHPSVIIWSLGNESQFGNNFTASRKRVKELDTSRPVMFSYPGHVPDSVYLYDILSMHYPDFRGVLKQYDKETRGFVSSDKIPALFDEWAHVACYDTSTLKQDPNIRDFWGRSLDRMWGKCFYSKGGLGGAIWGFVDETFMLPDTCIGYGEWGIIDTWRRKKPEFWNTKKAYSPFKLPLRYIVKFRPWEELKMPVFNRFDHTNLNELTITWDVGGQYGTIDTADLDIMPHKWGQLSLPAREWKKGETVYIEAKLNGFLIDRYGIALGEPSEMPPELDRDPATPALVIEEDGDIFTVSGKNFSVVFSSIDGLIQKVSGDKGSLLTKGPYLHFIKKTRPKGWVLGGEPSQDVAGTWNMKHIEKKSYGDSAMIKIEGSADALTVNWKIKIDKYGMVDVDYLVAGFDSLQVVELGIRWKLAEGFDSLSWKRRTYWSWYPDGHLGMPAGETPLFVSGEPQRYREHPGTLWAMDSRDFYLFGKNGAEFSDGMSNLVKGLKENIYSYRLTDSEHEKSLLVLSGGREACRLRTAGNQGMELVVDNLWDYVNLNWGNYIRDIRLKIEFKGHVRLYVGGKPVAY